MLELLIRNAEGNLSASDREYASKKLGRLDRYFPNAARAEIVHREDKSGHRVEVTVFADGFTVRGEEVDQNVRAAIDLVGEKLESRLRRLKSKIVDRYRKRAGKQEIPLALQEAEEDPSPAKFEIKERKQFLVKPMEVEEAALEMEMIGHPFFVFRNDATDRIEVLYKRRDGSFGLLQPEA